MFNWGRSFSRGDPNLLRATNPAVMMDSFSIFPSHSVFSWDSLYHLTSLCLTKIIHKNTSYRRRRWVIFVIKVFPVYIKTRLLRHVYSLMMAALLVSFRKRKAVSLLTSSSSTSHSGSHWGIHTKRHKQIHEIRTDFKFISSEFNT